VLPPFSNSRFKNTTIFIADTYNNRILAYDADTFDILLKIGSDKAGKENGQFNFPYGISGYVDEKTVQKKAYLFVAEWGKCYVVIENLHTHKLNL